MISLYVWLNLNILFVCHHISIISIKFSFFTLLFLVQFFKFVVIFEKLSVYLFVVLYEVKFAVIRITVIVIVYSLLKLIVIDRRIFENFSICWITFTRRTQNYLYICVKNLKFTKVASFQNNALHFLSMWFFSKYSL